MNADREEPHPRQGRAHFKRILKLVVLITVPVVLYFVLAAQVSWRPRTLANPEVPDEGYFFPPEPVAFSPDGQMLARSTGEGVQLWDVRRATLQRTLQLTLPYREKVMAPTFSRDGRTLAGGYPGALWLWDVESGQLKKTVKIPAERGQTQDRWPCEIFVDDRYLSVLYANDYFQFRDVHTGQQIRPSLHLPLVNWIYAIAPDWKSLLTVDKSSPLLRSLPDGKRLRYVGSQATVGSRDFAGSIGMEQLGGAVAFSPDSRLIAICNKQHLVRVWDGRTMTRLHEFKGPDSTHYILFLLFSHDNKTLVVGASRAVVFFDLATRAITRVIEGHEIVHAALSPDDATLATVETEDSTVTLWRIK